MTAHFLGGVNMKTITVTELSSRPGEVLDAVAHGQRMVVTRRGVPVADVVPHGSVRSRKHSVADMAEARRQLAMLRKADKRDDWSSFLEW